MMRSNMWTVVRTKWWVIGLVVYLVVAPGLADSIPHYWGSEVAKASVYGLLWAVAGYKLPAFGAFGSRRSLRAASYGVTGTAGSLALLYGPAETAATVLVLAVGCLLALAVLVGVVGYGAALFARALDTDRSRAAQSALSSNSARIEYTRFAALVGLAAYAATVTLLLPSGQGPFAVVVILAALPVVMITSGVVAARVLGVPSIWGAHRGD